MKMYEKNDRKNCRLFTTHFFSVVMPLGSSSAIVGAQNPQKGNQQSPFSLQKASFLISGSVGGQ
jgi:hypothetical protein